MTYAKRLAGNTAERGNLCVGIDPMPSVLAAWGLEPGVRGLEKCSRGIVEELGERIAVFKPQSAFFEAHGSRGIAVLERVLADIRDAGALSLLDVKRGDIGSSMAGYADAYLHDESALAADAITLSPYLGVGALLHAIDQAVNSGRGVYVLARTSNPEGTELQEHTAQLVIDEIIRLNPGRDHAIGLVVGATHSDLGCDLSGFNSSILAPGIGAQGGSIQGLSATFGRAAEHVLPTASREVIGAGHEELGPRATRLLEQMNAVSGL